MNEIAHLLKEIVSEPDLTISRAVVKKVNGRTCTVKYDATGLERSNVLLNLSLEKDKILLTPKDGSRVYVAEADGYEAFVVGYGELEKISIVINGVSLKATLDKLIDTLNAAIINTPNGAGTVSPDTKLKLDNIKTELGNIFE